MNRSWMNLPWSSEMYKNGVKYFLNFAFSNTEVELILCPCKKCKNGICKKRDLMEAHLRSYGFLDGYTKWVLHGELFSNGLLSHGFERDVDTSDNMQGLINDVFHTYNEDQTFNDETPHLEEQEPNEEAKNFYRLLKDAEQALYPGCKKFSKLSFVVRMLQIKCLGKWSDKSFSLMLDLLKESFPEGVQLPKNYYETKKTLKDLGLHYEKIDACKNDCMIYWGVNKTKDKCDNCGESRWKKRQGDDSCDDVQKKSKQEKKLAVKTFWYFPIKPRLQRLFMCSKTASLMTWHATERVDDGVMRHPADSPAWQTFDHLHPDFAKEPRNIRLGLAADGFSPYRSMNINHSTWPVVLMPYNLPPGECMKQSYFMLSILIPGPTEPGNNIDVYCEPLMVDLSDLWTVGVNTYDASKKQNFRLRASCLWTIHDLPGQANLSGWSTKGKLACPVCREHTNSEYLKNSHKHCYMSHRTFLPPDHPFRNDSRSFVGKEEHRIAPAYTKGSEEWDEIKDIENKFGKTSSMSNLPSGWKKKNMFYKYLSYWETNLLRHNLDVMHDEKNVCDKILFTSLNSDKSKDNKNARLDLKDRGIRPGLHPFVDENGKEWLPASCFAFDKQEKDQFCHVLKNVKVPDGYSADISKSVHLKPPKIIGLKSHDSHILMQQLIPLAMRNLLSNSVRSPLLCFSRYFRELCSKELHHSDLERMENEIVVTLCQLEKIYPPAFFDITVHVAVHLVTEAKLGGPVHYRWMYPIERYLNTLKSYVRNRGCPEGSIAEGYIAEECLNFCSLYLDEGIETRFNRPGRNADIENDDTDFEASEIFLVVGRPLYNGTPVVLDKDLVEKAHRYVLFNSDATMPYREEHEGIVRRKKHRSQEHEIKRIHSESFASWFSTHVQSQNFENIDVNPTDLKCIASGPLPVGRRFKGYIVNGFRFHTKELERKRKTQNCGVMLKASTTSFASRKDRRPVISELTYYGILKDIIELDYTGGRRVVLFECDWVSKGSKVKQDKDGFTLANFSKIKRQNEPFALASQVEQVFYVDDPVDKNWKVVIKTKPRDKFEDGKDSSDVDVFIQSEPFDAQPMDENEDISWVRSGVPPTSVELSD